MLKAVFSKVEQLNARRGADILLEVLASEGVEYIFGNPGTTELPLIDALLRTPDLKYVLALQEATAVAMADGYAQAARRPAFLNLHTAGGLGPARQLGGVAADLVRAMRVDADQLHVGPADDGV